MSHLIPRHHFCSVSIPLLAVLIAVLMAGDHQLFLGTANAQLTSTKGQQGNKPGAGPMDGSPLLFYLAGTYLAGGWYGANSVAVADLNGDGKPDLVVANAWECTGCDDGGVSVLLGNGDGTFQPAVTYSSGGTDALSVAVADLNGDGKPDLIVANCARGGYPYCGDGDGFVGVLLGNGDGTFQPPASYDAGAPYANSVSVADVNGDGRRDIVVTNGVGAGVLLGNGDGTFRAAVNYGSGGAAGLAVADLSGDGYPDIVITQSGEVGVLLGNGDGTFQSMVSYSSGGYEPYSVAIADVNGDGHLDLVVTNYCQTIECNGDGVVSVLLGNGDGTFRATVTYDPGGCCANSVALADVNGDGHLDIAVTRVGVGVLLGNGDGTFQTGVGYATGGYNAANSVAIADVNGDGKPDLLVTNDGSDTIGVLLNNSGAPLTTTTLTSSRNPVPAGRKNVVTYTASIAPQSGGAVTGNVMFRDGGATVATLPVANNQAAYSKAYTSGGVHVMTAVYSGDANNAGSTSGTLMEYVESYVTKTAVTTSGSPSQFGQVVTFTATVTSKKRTIPDGELVTFYDGNKALGSVALANGHAAYTTSTLSAKKHTIWAAYPGDSEFKPSKGHIIQVVDK